MKGCIILDDIHSIKTLAQFINQTSFLTLIGSASNSSSAIDSLPIRSADLLFLGFPGDNTNILRLVHPNSHVILCANLEHNSIEKNINQVADFLFKPISFKQFVKIVQRVLDYERLERFENFFQDNHRFIFVKTENKGKLIKIFIEDICFIEGLGNYVTIHTNKEEKIITYCSFNEIVNVLPSTFVRVHKSYLVAITYISFIEGNQIIIFNRRQITLPLGATYRVGLFDLLNARIIGGKNNNIGKHNSPKI